MCLFSASISEIAQQLCFAKFLYLFCGDFDFVRGLLLSWMDQSTYRPVLVFKHPRSHSWRYVTASPVNSTQQISKKVLLKAMNRQQSSLKEPVKPKPTMQVNSGQSNVSNSVKVWNLGLKVRKGEKLSEYEKNQLIGFLCEALPGGQLNFDGRVLPLRKGKFLLL